MGKIAVLPAAVQGQIAAGEVIERPASAVKELVENALDAGARRIDVRLEGGGVELMAVRDDGEGMAADDAVLAFARHATSKLACAEDLLRVGSLGFRGEALPSIAAVARVRVVTRRAEDAAATAVEADGRGARPAGLSGAPPGTTIEVRDLFAATPARRKFLRSAATEVGHVVDVLTRLAVASPATGIRLEHDGRQVLDFPPVREVRQRLGQVLGPERAGALVSVEATTRGAWLSGFLGPPRETVGSARLAWTYLAVAEDPARAGAPRWLRDKLLLRALLDGYESLLMRGRYPIAVLFLTVRPGEVDLNVHPAKLEVRFRQPALVHQLIVPAVRGRLAAALRGGPPRPTAPGDGAGEGLPLYGAAAGVPAAGPAAVEPEQAALWRPAPGGFGSLRFLGQLFDGYLLCEGDGRAVLIDQHAAHERVLFERLRAEDSAGGVARDALLVPATITLSSTEVAALVEHADDLAAAGFEGEPFGSGTFLLRTVPRLLARRDAGELLRALAAEVAENGASQGAVRARHRALATIACHGAVRVGQRLDAARVEALLDAMEGVPVNAHCPHGRPVAVELSRGQIEALFHR